MGRKQACPKPMEQTKVRQPLLYQSHTNTAHAVLAHDFGYMKNSKEVW